MDKSVWEAILLVQTKDHTGVNQSIREVGEKLGSFLIYSDRGPVKFTERLGVGCMRNYLIQGFWPEQLGKWWCQSLWYAEGGAGFGSRFKNLVTDMLSWGAHIDIPVEG